VIRSLSLTTAIATLILIAVGGVVRVSGSGLGCPDWPTCHGQIVPPLVLQAVIEYAHRFVASIVSLFVVLSAVYAWLRHRRDRWVLIPAIVAVVALAIQIALGAFTVALELTAALVTAHLATALALFATVTTTAAAARWAVGSGRHFRVDTYAALALVTMLLTYTLMLVGSFVTMSTAAYACAAWPLCGNGIQLPADDPSTLNLLHRVLVGLATIAFLAMVVWSGAARPAEPDLNGYLYAGLALLAGQIAIGAGVVLWRVPPFTAALHLAIGAAFFGDLVAIAFLACFPDSESSVAASELKPERPGRRAMETRGLATK
jgi:heme A synthase